MTEKRKTPALRFRGYTDDWEQRKFDKVFDCTIPNNTLSRAELSYDEGTVLNVHYGDVLVKYGSVLDVQRDEIPHIPQSCREDFRGSLLQDGDVIIADTAEDETTGKACEIGNLQGRSIVSGLHTMVCRPRQQMALGYLGYYLNSNAYHHQLLPLMQGIKVLSLSRSNIQKTSVSYPTSVEEQQLIASYFNRLDNLITLHQRKLERRLFFGCRFFIQGHTLTWCPATKEQGIAGSEAPRPTRRSPILLRRRGARRRKNKALRGAKHHAQPAEAPFCPKDVVPGDERTRYLGE